MNGVIERESIMNGVIECESIMNWCDGVYYKTYKLVTRFQASAQN